MTSQSNLTFAKLKRSLNIMQTLFEQTAISITTDPENTSAMCVRIFYSYQRVSRHTVNKSSINLKEDNNSSQSNPHFNIHSINKLVQVP